MQACSIKGNVLKNKKINVSFELTVAGDLC